MEIKDIDIEVLIVRYLEETCTPDERECFLTWLHSSEENKKQFYEMKELYDSRLRLSDRKMIDPQIKDNAIWNRLYDQITYLESPEVEIRRPLLKRIPEWLKLAAVIVFMAGLSYLYVENNKQETPVLIAGQMQIYNTKGVHRVTLPDSTKVWLHGGTTITYPEHFTTSTREITLDGEAYFQVKSDKKSPFIIHTDLAQIRATGTEFNVTAYSIDDMAITTLVSGTVDVLANNGKEPVVMSLGQQSIVRADSETVQLQKIDSELFVDWKDGIYRFKKEPLERISLQLEKMFGIKILIPSERLRNTRFSGMFTEDHSLKEVFEIINISSPITYKINGKNVTLIDKSYKVVSK